MRTIRDAPRVFAPIVRSLRIICHVPEDFMKVTADNIGYLLKTCPSLTRVSLGRMYGRIPHVRGHLGIAGYARAARQCRAIALSCLSQDID